MRHLGWLSGESWCSVLEPQLNTEQQIAQFTEVRKQFSFKTFNQLKFLASAEMVLVWSLMFGCSWRGRRDYGTRKKKTIYVTHFLSPVSPFLCIDSSFHPHCTAARLSSLTSPLVFSHRPPIPSFFSSLCTLPFSAQPQAPTYGALHSVIVIH